MAQKDVTRADEGTCSSKSNCDTMVFTTQADKCELSSVIRCHTNRTYNSLLPQQGNRVNAQHVPAPDDLCRADIPKHQGGVVTFGYNGTEATCSARLICQNLISGLLGNTGMR